jgi:hypothetical protein
MSAPDDLLSDENQIRKSANGTQNQDYISSCIPEEGDIFFFYRLLSTKGLTKISQRNRQSIVKSVIKLKALLAYMHSASVFSGEKIIMFYFVTSLYDVYTNLC